MRSSLMNEMVVTYGMFRAYASPCEKNFWCSSEMARSVVTSSDTVEELDDASLVDSGGGDGCCRIVTPEVADVDMT